MMIARRSFIGIGAAAVGACVSSVVAEAAKFPRRLSTLREDSSYAAWDALIKEGRKIVVRLDGVEQKQCETADVGLGYVVCALVDDAGDIFCIEHDGQMLKEIAREVVYGKVEIEIT